MNKINPCCENFRTKVAVHYFDEVVRIEEDINMITDLLLCSDLEEVNHETIINAAFFLKQKLNVRKVMDSFFLGNDIADAVDSELIDTELCRLTKKYLN